MISPTPNDSPEPKSIPREIKFQGNPFEDDVFLGSAVSLGDPDGNGIPGSVGTMNAGAVDRLAQELKNLTASVGSVSLAPSKIILLLAPRAGFGKSHLLADVCRRFAGRASVVPLSFDREAPARWQHVMPQVLKAFERRDSGSFGGQLTGLDFVARHVFATASRQLVHTGLVPCADPVKAESLLARDAMGLFDFSDPGQPVATWFRDTFEKLLSPAGREISLYAGIAPERVGYWMRALFSYAEGYGDPAVRRTDTLRWVLSNPADAPTNPTGMDLATVGRTTDAQLDSKLKTLDFCRLATLWRPVVFVIDHLDAFHGSPEAGRDIATLVSDLQYAVPGSLTVISSNEDVWDSTFGSGLPSAIEDRLTGSVLHLTGMDAVGAEALIAKRLATNDIDKEDADEFLSSISLGSLFAGKPEGSVSARTILRYAAEKWNELVGTDESFSDQADEFDPGLVGGFLFPDDGNDVSSAAFPDISEAQQPASAPLNVFDPAPAIAPGLRGSIQESINGLSSNGGLEDLGLGAAPLDEASEKQLRPLGDLKGMIDRFRHEHGDDDINETKIAATPSDSPNISTTSIPTVQEALSAAAPTVLKAPPPLPAQPADGLSGAGVPGRFAGARTRWAGMNGALSKIDHGKLRHLISVAGNRFPVIRCEEIDIPEFEEQPVVRWIFGDTEVYFGFRPADETAFWHALGSFIDRPASDDPEQPTQKTKIKIVHFDTESGGGSQPDLGIDCDLIDTIVFDPSAVASVYAAEEIVRDAESGEIDADPGSVLGVLARELDFLWKRLTRPV